MEVNQLRLHIEDFRAIKEADIILNGITVVAGENGSGKSTLSKFLYYTVKNLVEYNELVNRYFTKNIDKYLHFINDYYNISGPIYDDKRTLISTLEKNLTNEMLWSKTIDDLPFGDKSELTFIRTQMIKNVLGDQYTSQWKDSLKSKIQELFKEVEEYREKRPSFLLKNQLSKAFLTNKLPQKYELTEYNNPIISNDSSTLLRLNTIALTAYIDTPMLLDLENTDIDYWNDVNKLLRNKHSDNLDHSSDDMINDIIKHEIIKGDTYLEKDIVGISSFIYQREDGTKFNLLECATGIKSFAILQMLLKKGVLNKYTLLIMDEPEVHLHPQWIVEFARLIVLLNKHIGVKFFIASHDPDMVAAIKYIGEKEKIDNNINFYLAQKQENSFTYSYFHTGMDIEAIFESFNLSIERMNQYSDIKEEEE